MKRLKRFVFVTFLTIFVPSTTWAACDLSNLNPETLLQIAGLPRDQALQELKSICDGIRNEMERLQSLADRAQIDPLTQLPNRLGINTRFEKRATSSGHMTFVAMLDIDHFKRVNDTFGHEQGDVVLAQVAKDLQNVIVTTLRTDDFVGRWGGEEFIVIFDAKDVLTALQVMGRLRLAVQSFLFNAVDLSGRDQSFRKTISIGLAHFTSKSEGLNQVRERADKALYEAKRSRNTSIYIPAPVTDCETGIINAATPAKNDNT